MAQLLPIPLEAPGPRGWVQAPTAQNFPRRGHSVDAPPPHDPKVAFWGSEKDDNSVCFGHFCGHLRGERKILNNF